MIGLHVEGLWADGAVAAGGEVERDDSDGGMSDGVAE